MSYLDYTSIPTNKDSFSFFVRIYPQFAHDAGSVDDHVIFEYKYDGTNYMRVYYDSSEETWRFQWRAASTTNLVSSAQNFVAGEEIELAGAISTSKFYKDTYYAIFYVNSILEDSETSSAPAAMSANLNALTIGNNVAHTKGVNSIIDELVTAVKPFSPDELKRMRFAEDSVLNINGIVEYNGTLAQNDILLISGHTGEAERFTEIYMRLANAQSEVEGRVPSFRGDEDEKQWIYLPNAMNEFRISWRAHWR